MRARLVAILVVLLLVVPVFAQEDTECFQHGGLNLRGLNHGGDNALVGMRGDVLYDLGPESAYYHIRQWAVNDDGVVYVIAENSLRGERQAYVFIGDGSTYVALTTNISVWAAGNSFLVENEEGEFNLITVDPLTSSFRHKEIEGSEVDYIRSQIICD